MEKKFDDNDEMQIDLLELAYALKKKLWLIILGLIVGAFGAGLYSKILLTPIYKSTAMVYVLSKETLLPHWQTCRSAASLPRTTAYW